MPNVLVDPSTTSTATGAVQAHLVRKALLRLERDFHYLKYGAVTDLPSQGPTVTWYRWTNMTASTSQLTLDVNPSPTWLSNANQSATVGLWGGYAPVGESLRLYKAEDPMTEIANLIGYWAALSLDTITRNYCSGNTYTTENMAEDEAHPSTWMSGLQGGFSFYAISGNGNQLSYAQFASYMTISNLAFANAEWGLSFKLLRSVVAKMRQNAAPTMDDGYYHAIIDPKSANQVMSDPEWQNMQQFTGRAELEKGRIDETRTVGVICHITQNNFVGNSSVFSVGATTVSVAFNLIVGREAYGLTGFKIGGSKTKTKGFEIVRKVSGPQDTSNPLSLYETIGFKAHFVAKVLQAQAGYWLTTLQA